MNILFRYVAREFLKLFGLCLGGFVFLYLLVDFIEQSNTFFKNQASGGEVAMFFVYKTPLIVFQVTPPAILLGTLLVLTLLSKNSEIVAMQAGGVSLYRIVTPVLLLAILLSAFSFALNEYVVPYTTERAEYVKRVEIKGRQPAVRKKRKDLWYKTQTGIYNVQVYNTETSEMRDISIWDFDERFRLERRIDAARARWTGEGWEFQDGMVRTFDANQFISGEAFDAREIEIAATPEDLSTVVKDAEEMSYRELKELIAQVQGEGLDVTRHRVDLQGKLAFPLVSVVMALLGIPFALRGGRQGGVAVGIAIAVAVGVVYWLVMGTFLSFGYSGALPPSVAAWGSHVLFAGIGVAMLIRTRK